MTSPDPVRQADAYQRSLLDALGDDDPAEAQASTPARVRRLIADAGPDLRTKPAPREWSVLECIGHLVDAETVMAARYRWVIAHDEPELLGYDQDLWSDELRHNEDDQDDLVVLFEALRAANIALWRKSTPEQRARGGLHRERGRETYELMFRMLGGHDRVHLDQADRALADVRRSAAS
ncbi:MAG TPA: DinB family protein [Candidatus Limnocylindrales bacterium]|nr:DinB family protein [Candidatus Limnocylindrales bacterium]